MFENTTEIITEAPILQLSETIGNTSWYSSIEKLSFIFGLAVFAFVLLIAAAMCSDIAKFIEQRKIEEKKRIHGKSGKKDVSMMDQMSRMIEDILENESDKEVDLQARNKIRGTSLPLQYKIKKSLKDMMTNPYNPVSVPKMILLSGIIGLIGFGLGIFMENFIFCVALAIIGAALPIIFISVASLNNQLKILQGNMGLMSSHLGIYKESNNIADSFRSLLNVLTPDTREYKAIYRAHGSIVEANMDLYDVTEKLKHELLADKIVSQYFDLCYIADTKSAEYKDALDYLPRRLEPIVMKNILYSTIIKVGFIAYIASAVVIVATLFYYKLSDYSSFQFFTQNSTGMILSFVFLSLYIAIGYGFTKIANLIML